jgi:TolA-binding protein
VSSKPAAHALDDAERLWTVGARAFEDGLYDLSIRMLDRLVDRFPTDPHVGEASLLIGQARLSQKGFQPALDAFRRAQGLTPPPGQAGEPRFWEAETLFRMKRFADAHDLYERVVAEHGSSPVAADALSMAWRGAISSSRERSRGRRFPPASLRYPEHRSAPSATFYLARTLVDLKRPDEAVALLRAFPTKYPGHRLAPDSRYLLGQALVASGDSKEGLSELRAFAANYPNHDLAPQARRLAADAVMKKGSKAEQENEYKQLLAQSPPTAEGLYDAGVIASKLGRPREEVAQIGRASCRERV